MDDTAAKCLSSPAYLSKSFSDGVWLCHQVIVFPRSTFQIQFMNPTMNTNSGRTLVARTKEKLKDGGYLSIHYQNAV
jgi:hypothetical protein